MTGLTLTDSPAPLEPSSMSSRSSIPPVTASLSRPVTANGNGFGTNSTLKRKSEDALSEDTETKKKRNRQALSCSECKRRKIKCDRKIPCVACIKRGEHDKCHWEDAKKEVAPQPFALATEFHALQSRVARLESQLAAQSQVQEGDAPSAPIKQSPSESVTTDHTSPAAPCSLKPSELDSLLRTISLATRVLKIEKNAADPAQALEDIAMDAYVPIPSKTSAPARNVESDISPSIIRDPPTIRELEHVTNRIRLLVDQVEDDKEKRNLDLIWGILPTDKNVADTIIGWYFERFSWAFNVLHKPSWETWYNDFWKMIDRGSRHEIEPAFLAVYATVLTLGIVCYHPTTDPPLPGIQPEDYSHLPDLYHLAADMALDVAKWADSPNYMSCLAIGLYIPFMCVRGPTCRLRIRAAAGLNICNQLGYDRLSQLKTLIPHDSKGLPPGKNILKREMCLWLYQNFMWVESVFPYASTPVQWESTILPLNCNQADLSPVSMSATDNPQTTMTDASFDLLRLRIGLLSSKIVRVLYSGTFSYNHVQEFDREYQALLENRPPEMTPEHIMPENKEVNSIMEAQSVLATEQIYNRIMRLHRPFFIRGYSDPKYERSTSACLCAARMVLSMLRRLREGTSILPAWQFFSVHEIASSLVVIIDLLHAVEENHAKPFTPLRASEMEQRRKEVQDCVESFKMTLRNCSVFSQHLVRTCLIIMETLLAAEEEYRLQARSNSVIPHFEDVLNDVLTKLSQRAEDHDRPKPQQQSNATESDDAGWALLQELGLVGTGGSAWFPQAEDQSLRPWKNVEQSSATPLPSNISNGLSLWEGTDWLLKYFRDDDANLIGGLS